MTSSERPTGGGDPALEQALSAELRERLDERLGQTAPPQLRPATSIAERGSQGRGSSWLLAAACLLVALGGVAGWFVRDFVGGPRPTAGRAWSGLARDALSAHRAFAGEIAHPVEVKADAEAHLAQWLSDRLKRRVVVPDLTDQFGLDLVGGRLLPAGPDVAAQLMYADKARNRLTLYVRTGETGETALNFMREGDVSTFAWIDQGTGFVVVAPMDRERLQKVARAISQEYDLEAARRRRAL